MHVARLVGSVALVVMTPAALMHAQQDVLQARLDSLTYRALQPILAAAHRDSLPLRALEAKALEGAAKRRPSAQIVAAVAQLAGELRETQTRLMGATGTRPPAREVVAAAEARRRGVSLDEIMTLRDNAPADVALEIPYALLGELVQRGVPVGQARGVIEQLLRSGVPQHRLVDIPQRVDVALRVGASPLTALGSALQGLGIPVPMTPGPPQRPERPPVPNP